MRQFPVLHSSHREGEAEFIPWEILDPHEKQAYINHGQSLEQLARRGGLSWREIYAVIMDKEFDYGSKHVTDYYRRAVLIPWRNVEKKSKTDWRPIYMISAKEAREKSEKATQNGIQKEIEKIEPEIEEAILQGKNHVTLDGSLSKPTGDYLRSLGYQVEHGSQYNESYFTIKW